MRSPATMLSPTESFLKATTVLLALLFFLLYLTEVCSQGDGSNLTVSLINRRYWDQPVLVAPDSSLGSIYFNGSYTLNNVSGSLTAKASSANAFPVPGNGTVFLGTYTRTSCLTIDLNGSDSAVYAIITTAQIEDGSGTNILFDPQSSSGASGVQILGSALPGNSSAARQLALNGKNASAASGPISYDTYLNDTLSIVLINPSPQAKSARLKATMSPAGHCQKCNQEQNDGGFLGNCTALDLANSTVQFQSSSPNVSAGALDLVPFASWSVTVQEGESEVYFVFANTSCMLYTVDYPNPPPDFIRNNAYLRTWVSPSSDQNQIIRTASVSPAQEMTNTCTLLSDGELCSQYNASLSPTDTYFFWMQNIMGGSVITNGSMALRVEFIISGNGTNCGQGRLNSLSTLAASTSQTYSRSPFDPGVVPGYFRGTLQNTRVYYISRVGSDGSLSQASPPPSSPLGPAWLSLPVTSSGDGQLGVSWRDGFRKQNLVLQAGTWNLTGAFQNGSSLISPSVKEVFADSLNFALANDYTSIASYALFPTFTNAACLLFSWNASDIVSSFIFTKNAFRNNFNTSSQVPLSANLLSASVNSVFHMVSKSQTVSLLPNETYVFLMNGAQYPNIPNVTVTKLVTYPPGSSACNQTNSSAPTTAAGTAGNATAVRGVSDIEIQMNSAGGSDCTGAITGASCIAFVLSARGAYSAAATLPNLDFNVNSTGNSSGKDFNASAILLAGNKTNTIFMTTGFTVNNQSANSTLSITAGCNINASSPGPCSNYADHLDPNETYFLWAVLGKSSASTSLLASFEALPSGSCQNLYPPPAVAPVVGPSGPPPSSSTTLSTPSPPQSSSSSVGPIVGGIVAGIVVLAAAVFLFGYVRLGWFRKAQPRHHLKPLDMFPLTEVRNDEETEQYIHFNDLLSIKSINFGSELPPSLFPVPVGSDSSELPPSNSNATPNSESGGQAPDALSVHSGPSSGKQGSFKSASDELTKLQDQWEIDLTNLQIKASKTGVPLKLGQGGCGVVLLGIVGIREVAVKTSTGKTESQKRDFLQEIKILKSCRDPSIVQFLGANVNEEQTVLLMEYMPGGDLFRRLQGPRRTFFLWYRRGRRIALDIAQGLDYLHSRRILHLDLKSPNILLTASMDAKIADVGLAKIISDDGTAATKGVSLPWASPEQLLGDNCTYASDMFSFGVVLWEICTGDAPSNNRQFPPLDVPKQAPQAVADLIVQCLKPDAAQRPTAREAYRILRSSAKASRQP